MNWHDLRMAGIERHAAGLRGRGGPASARGWRRSSRRGGRWRRHGAGSIAPAVPEARGPGYCPASTDRLALVAVVEPDVIVAVGSFARTAPDQAEAALLVEDAYQGRGLGRVLLHQLAREARARGIRVLHGAVLLDNARVLRLLRSSGYPLAVA